MFATLATTARAQESWPQKPPAVVIEQVPRGEIRGVLVQLGPEIVTVLVGSERRELSLDNVATIAVKGDSVKNGALIGGIIGAAWCAVVCGQGLDSASQIPLAVAANAGLFALVGAGVDAMIPGKTIIYPRPQTPSARPAPVLSLRWRF